MASTSSSAASGRDDHWTAPMMAAPSIRSASLPRVGDGLAEALEDLLVRALRIVEPGRVEVADAAVRLAVDLAQLPGEVAQLPDLRALAGDHRLPGDTRIGEVERGGDAVR